MGSRLHTILILIIIIPLLLFAAAWYFFVKPAVESRLNLAISSFPTPITGGPLEIFFFGVKAPSTLTINTKPIPLPLEKAYLSLSPLSLLRLSPKLRLTTDIFGGHIDGDLSYKITDSSYSTQIVADGLQIVKYQLASMLGISDGIVNFKFEQRSPAANVSNPIKLFFTIKNFKKPKASKLPQWISPLAINIPAIENAEFVAEAGCGSLGCKSSRIFLTSSLGEVSGNMTFPLSGIGPIDGSFTISLTQTGRTNLLPLFAIFNQNLLPFPDKPFVMKLSGPSNNPKLTVVPIQNSL